MDLESKTLKLNLKVDYMRKDLKVAEILIYQGGKVECTLFTDDKFDNPLPLGKTRESFYNFLESRCFPENRVNCRELLDLLGVEEYSPLSICKKTHGVQNDDFYWIKFNDEKITFDEVRVR